MERKEGGITTIALVVIALIAIMLVIIMVNTFRKKEPKNVGAVQGEEQNVEQEEYVQERNITIEVLDKQGNVITSLNGTIDTVGAGEKVQLNMSVTGDVANAYDFKIR